MSKITFDEIKKLHAFSEREGYTVLFDGDPIKIQIPSDEDYKLWLEDEDHHEGIPSFVFDGSYHCMFNYFEGCHAKDFTVTRTEQVDWRGNQVEIT